MYRQTWCLLILLSSVAHAELNIATEKYVENRHVEVFLNADEISGSISTRPVECVGCPIDNLTFDETLRVIFNGKDYPVGVLKQWKRFTGDVVTSKRTGRLVALKRVQ